ncbi:filamin-A-like [Saccostrea cucullata]|uniref:filamin-A-like n=1 Tax=Saccostrea cuccullata TaxID=36930 RepID=UPI002ED11944
MGDSSPRSGKEFSKVSPENRWVEIQRKTFTNWINEQLSVSGKAITDIETDFCDGVNLVALVESLQFKKIGKVIANPTGRIQKIENVSLACKAIMEDNVRLVNIGNDDIVNGNGKLILGLIWHLIVRYQISSRKTKVPPKKLMMNWFRLILPDLEISNFTSDWSTGIPLHALVDYLRPGTSPRWRELHSKDAVENCRTAMVLAKEHLNIPRVISPEDFASEALDELSAMTYLSYFVRSESPGYYDTLNWVCKQLRTTQITNLTTDWNDGYNLCAVVTSLGGTIENWPDINRDEKINNIQMAIDAGKRMGVDPILSASEIADSKIDHLSIMTYLNRFRYATPVKSDNEKLTIQGDFDSLLTGVQTHFKLIMADKDVKKELANVQIKGPRGNQNCDVTWKDKFADCRFTPVDPGSYALTVSYNSTPLVTCPVNFSVKADLSKVKLRTPSSSCMVGSTNEIEVVSESESTEVSIECCSPNDEVKPLTTLFENGVFTANFRPKSVGLWIVHVFCQGEEISSSPISFDVYDPQKAWLSGPQKGIVGEEAVFTVNFSEAGIGEIEAAVRNVGKEIDCEVKDTEYSGVKTIEFIPQNSGMFFVYSKFNNTEITGSPKSIDILDPGQILVTGEGLTRGMKGKECMFQVNTGDLGGNIHVVVENEGKEVDTSWREAGSSTYIFSYVPTRAGTYKITVLWDDRPVPGSPFYAKITDRSRVTLITDLTDLMDENGALALVCGVETCLKYDISSAGPGRMSAAVLSPRGKLKVDLRTVKKEEVEVAFTAVEEGDHYIHIYWSDVPLDSSPILSYCPGPILPIDHTKVVIEGKGRETARALVPAEFLINGRQAGPGTPRALLKGVKRDVDVDIKPMKYDRYKCTYIAPNPGAYVLFVYWSEQLVPGCPFKITVSSKGASDKVKVTGQGLRGGYVGQELRLDIDTTEAGFGEIKVNCHGELREARCDVFNQRNGFYKVHMYPREACRYRLEITYDHEHVPGSPFKIPVGEPPDPRKVKVYGPGVQDGLVQTFESKFLVETVGAGAGQLAVRIRGPRGAFKVNIQREEENDRTVLCSYDPEEPGEYVIGVKWSGRHVRGSPFHVHLFESQSDLDNYLGNKRGFFVEKTKANLQWRAEI